MKAFFFDIDGTLLDFKTKTISPSTIEALHSLQQKGYKIGLASSRPYEGIRLVQELFTINWDGIVGANGMDILKENLETYEDNSFSKEQLKSFFNIASQLDIPIYSCGEEIFFTGMNDTVKEFKKKYDLPINTVKPYGSQNQKLITFVTRDKEKVREAFKDVQGVEVIEAGEFNTDIFPVGLTKLYGIHQLMKYWGFEENDFMCFGDTKSDNPMIIDAKIGVAMPNAIPETKAVADYICPEESIDAISDCLKHFNFI